MLSTAKGLLSSVEFYADDGGKLRDGEIEGGEEMNAEVLHFIQASMLKHVFAVLARH